MPRRRPFFLSPLTEGERTVLFFVLKVWPYSDIWTPPHTPWPLAFSVAFGTNVTAAEAQKGGAWGSHAVKGKLFFHSSRRQRIVHGEGARECVQYHDTTGDCALVFAEDAGMFALTEHDAKCCLDTPWLRKPPANWTIQAKHSPSAPALPPPHPPLLSCAHARALSVARAYIRTVSIALIAGDH